MAEVYAQVARGAGGLFEARLFGPGGWMTLLRQVPFGEAWESAQAVSITLRCSVRIPTEDIPGYPYPDAGAPYRASEAQQQAAHDAHGPMQQDRTPLRGALYDVAMIDDPGFEAKRPSGFDDFEDRARKLNAKAERDQATVPTPGNFAAGRRWPD